MRTGTRCRGWRTASRMSQRVRACLYIPESWEPEGERAHARCERSAAIAGAKPRTIRMSLAVLDQYQVDFYVF